MLMKNKKNLWTSSTIDTPENGWQSQYPVCRSPCPELSLPRELSLGYSEVDFPGISWNRQDLGPGFRRLWTAAPRRSMPWRVYAVILASWRLDRRQASWGRKSHQSLRTWARSQPAMPFCPACWISWRRTDVASPLLGILAGFPTHRQTVPWYRSQLFPWRWQWYTGRGCRRSTCGPHQADADSRVWSHGPSKRYNGPRRPPATPRDQPLASTCPWWIRCSPFFPAKSGRLTPHRCLFPAINHRKQTHTHKHILSIVALTPESSKPKCRHDIFTRITVWSMSERFETILA